MSFHKVLNKHMNSIKEKNLEEFKSTIHHDSIMLILGNGHMIRDQEEFIQFHEEWFADEDWSIDMKL